MLQCWLTGRLTREEIARMISDAEKYTEEDNRHRDRLQARNNLESYALRMRSTFEGPNAKTKLSADQLQRTQNKIHAIIRWLDSNQVLLSVLANFL